MERHVGRFHQLTETNSMAIDAKTLGSRLKQSRENRQLTQEEAARAIGISRTALEHIEVGARSLSTLEFSQLAMHYRRPVTDFFAEEEMPTATVDATKVTPSWLSPEHLNDTDVNHRVSRWLELFSIGVELERTLGVKGAFSLPPDELPSPEQELGATRQIIRLATEAYRREEVSLGWLGDLSEKLDMAPGELIELAEAAVSE